LLEGRDKDADRIAAELRAIDNDVERKEHGLELLARELAAAEQAEREQDIKRLRKLAEQAKRQAPDLYARYEKVADEVFAALDALDELQATVDAYNNVASPAEQLTSLNHDARGGQAGEQRVERGRRELGKFWAFPDGREVPGRLLTTLEANGTSGTVLVVDFDNAGAGHTLPEVDGQGPDQWFPKRRVPVVLLRRVEIAYDDARSAFVPPVLRHGVSLPHVVLADDRAPRSTGTTVITERVESAKADSEAA
jgi:hypothetical protein